MENDQPGVTPAAPAGNEPAAPAAPANGGEPNGSEPVTNSGSPSEQTVPFQRFQEVNDGKKAAEDRAAELEAELEAARATPQTPTGEEDEELDPDVEKLFDRYRKKHGLLSQEELNNRELQAQTRIDIADLKKEYANSSVPFDDKEVYQYARANNLPITSKAAWRAAYRDMHFDKLVGDERQRGITQFKESGASGAEKPGSTGQPPVTEEPKVQGTRSRIHAALAKRK